MLFQYLVMFHWMPNIMNFMSLFLLDIFCILINTFKAYFVMQLHYLGKSLILSFKYIFREKLPQGSNLDNSRTYLVYFSSLGYHVLYYLLLSVLKATVSGERINLLPVIPTWMVAELQPAFQIIFIIITQYYDCCLHF